METCYKHIFVVHVLLHFCHGIRTIGRGFPHEGFEKVARLEACAPSHKFCLIGSLGNYDGLTIEVFYITAQAFLRFLLDAEHVRGRAFYLMIRYKVVHELCVEGIEVVYGSNQ